MDEIIRFSVSLPKSLLDELDKKIAEQGYASRSELTRDLIREKMVKDSWETSSGELVGVLTVIYTHHQNELVVKMLELEHDADIKIVCTTHIHIDHHNCLETLVLRGEADKIKRFSDRISGLKGVKFAELTKAAVPHT
ncbi:nickel-responsive transcriptional regulator NikR [Campylobacter sp. RM9344]|uniref:Putative nickel-responsive regulator n=1 Tax=Campylobacter californiensis TaxID=1032243 RepID=A0AAW3ZVC3_9BACT|nr:MULTISPECIES: nickel-responsive transcriptional regulator NikR [unclassified Campylobacter]MBE2984283.1 nickel-responsive transcriptional regulator NikR [Campylobacter sp. RM6883]MBE2985962.1 nickel-responsive transcriptional regulator NikR [Campylobacter sp. RM12919]MBE2988163.1 nickel-responsive transcriptional regulator NikR [Campylobacter sp. RM12920]MBE2994850.1 nickel-responsive transcriptional regulator NikR [Campylobacter sp. RM6913]MBE3021377.1 nickel-responsive transcriptional reg